MSNLERVESQEAKRTQCLTYIREVAKNYADHQPDDSEQILSKASIRNLLMEAKVCDFVFMLFDEAGSGRLLRQEWLEGMRKSAVCFNEVSCVRLEELVNLLENASCKIDFMDKEAFGEIWRSERVVEKIVEIVDCFVKTKENSDNGITINSFMQFIMVITIKNVGAGLTDEHIERLRNVFEEVVGEGGLFTLAQFKKVVPSKNVFFVERIFSIFDRDSSGRVSLAEFMEGMSQFSSETDEQKIRFLFKVYDSKNDGRIDEEEMRAMMVACLKENGLDFDDQVIADLANALYEDAVQDGSDGVTIDDLMKQLRRHEGLIKNMTIDIGKLLVPPKAQPKRSMEQTISSLIPQAMTMNHWRERKSFFFFLLFIFIINFILFIHRTVYFKDFSNLDGSSPNLFYMISRGCGRLLLFNSVFILVLVLRYALTVLRDFGFGIFLPIDHHIFIHKVTGWFICILSWIHTIMHLCNFAINIQPNPVRFVQLTSKYWQEHFQDNSAYGFILWLGYNVPEGCSLVYMNDSIHFTELTATFPHIERGIYNNSCPPEDQETPLVICQSCPVNSTGPWSFMDFIITTRPGVFGVSGGISSPTGVALIIIISSMTFFSLPFVRRSGYFQIFYITHMLYFFYWTLLLLHAPEFWKWFIGPGILFGIEIFYRTINGFINRGKTVVCAGVLLPSKVTQLIIRRPPGFNFSPGDWVFVRIPELTSSEWHPFTISSAPEVPGTFALHIRGVGAWTNNLYQYFEHKYQDQKYGTTTKESFDLRKSIRRRVSTAKNSVSKKSIPTDNKSIRTGHHICRQEKYASNKDRQEERMNVRRNKLLKRSMSQPISNSEKSEAEQGDSTTMKSIRYLRTTPNIVHFNTELVKNQEDAKNITELLDVVTEKGRPSPKDIDFTESGRRTDLNKKLVIHIDGPFGSPSSDIYRANHAVLIATGIGVTPYASILQSIMHKFWNTKTTCPNCNFQWTDHTFSNEMYNLKKVDFFWINRDQKSFEWFIKLLSQLEIEQAEQGGEMDRFLDMHMYITSALKKTDMKAVGLQLALDLLHLKQKRDLVTGLKARTNAGRPDWDVVFGKIKEERRGQVSVFYCGNAALSKTLKLKCAQFGFKFKKEVF